jgi:hypothetical protein
VSVQRKIQSPSNVTEKRGGGSVVEEDVGCRRASAPVRIRSTVVQWCRFSVPRTGGEAKGAEGQRKKTMAWGKKERFTPAALFICRRVRIVGVVVLHYPDRFCDDLPRGGTEWGGGYYNRATRP